MPILLILLITRHLITHPTLPLMITLPTLNLSPLPPLHLPPIPHRLTLPLPHLPPRLHPHPVRSHPLLPQVPYFHQQ